MHQFIVSIATENYLDIQNALPEHVQDIEDPNHLSLEEEKWRSAEEKHLKVFKVIFGNH